MKQPNGYRVEERPGDYTYYRPKHFEEAKRWYKTSRIWTLYDDPITAGSSAVAVFFGGFWIEPAHSKGFDLTHHTPLYLGPRVIPEAA